VSRGATTPSMGDAQMSDHTMLQALVSSEERLGEGEGGRFADMLDKLGTGKGRKLSSRQREYVAKRFTDLELDADVALNLHSNGKAPAGYKKGPDPLANIPEQFRHPLRPPGR
jgi:hypothetical protein